MTNVPTTDAAASVTDDAPTTWIVTDGRAGMVNQCRGLAAVLGVTAAEKTIDLAAPWKWLPPNVTPARLSVLSAAGDRLAPPWPELLIASGRKSVAPALAVRRASGGQTFCVQVQNPAAALDKFDLIVTPQHDRLSGGNVIATLGSLNAITPAVLDEARVRFADAVAGLPRPLIAVLLGGNNAVYRMDEAVGTRLGDDLAALVDDKGYGLVITASRRTPDEALAAIKARLADALANSRAVLWDGTGENPYFGYLAHADAIVVTGDSVNMISEAAATGKPVHVIELPGGSDKFRRFHASMRDAGITRPFTGAIEQWSYPVPDDTARAATEIRRRMKLAQH